MKNKAWFFLLILVFGSLATVSAFAFQPYAENFAGEDQEISNDEATTDRMDAVEAAETCADDCTKAETATCDATIDDLDKSGYRACLKRVEPFCERKCN